MQPRLTGEHRPLHPRIRFPENLAVARPVGRKEIESTPKAEEALIKEWGRLRAIRTWLEDQVQEWSVVRRELGPGVINHVGRIFEICVETNAELPESDLRRKFKGRVVFQGNNVWGSNFDYAIFQELSSNPATMDAANAADLVSLFPGNSAMQADATQAYTQSELGGVRTWVRLPKNRWPKKWHEDKMVDPVCPLRLALYGHPDAGGHWENTVMALSSLWVSTHR